MPLCVGAANGEKRKKLEVEVELGGSWEGSGRAEEKKEEEGEEKEKRNYLNFMDFIDFVDFVDFVEFMKMVVW